MTPTTRSQSTARTTGIAARGRRERGFTLIETMMMVAVIGVLAGIAVPLYQAHRDRVRSRMAGQEVAAMAAFCLYDAPPSMTGAVLDVNGASYVR